MDLIETNLTESRLITPRNKFNLLLLTTTVNIIGRQGAFEKINKKANILIPEVITSVVNPGVGSILCSPNGLKSSFETMVLKGKLLLSILEKDFWTPTPPLFHHKTL